MPRGTRREVENPVGWVLRKNRLIRLANRAVLLARDGTERQITNSCAPIRDPGGRVLGAVLVFQDVTGSRMP